MKVLVISLAGIGDTLFATPLLHELREAHPQAQIDVLVMWPGSRDLLLGNPHATQVYQKNLIVSQKSDALRFLWGLRRRGYDVSINTHPQSRLQYRMVARLIGARVRVSHKYHRASTLDRLLVNRSINQDYARHSIENNLALLRCLGAEAILREHDYEVYLSAADLEWAEKYVAEQGISGQKLLGIHVGSGGTKNLALRRWPPENFVELIKRLERLHPDVAVLLFGGPDEKSDCEQIMAQAGHSRAFRPATSNIRQAAALLKKCNVFLSVDTSLMHLAAAVKVPAQIVIETPTWNKPIEPYRSAYKLVKNPSVAGRNLEYYRYDGSGIRGTRDELLRCMASVSVDSVYEAVAKALKQ